MRSGAVQKGDLMKKHPYVIVAPPYRNSSAGVRVLYKLGEMLKERGYEVKMTEGCIIPQGTICVYPEGVKGNPLDADTVVRYVLYYPGVLDGDKEYAKSEIIFTYHKQFYDAPVLTISVIEDFFRNENLPRSGGCFWVGKGMQGFAQDFEEFNKELMKLSNITEITYDWPATREEMPRLFNEKEVFYTYDNCTAMIDEARRCGCRVEVIGPPVIPMPAEAQDVNKQLDEFIRITQEAAAKEIKAGFGLLVNDPQRLKSVFVQSELSPAIPCHYIKEPETACKGLNKVLEILEAEGHDIAILSHQDMYYRAGWLRQVKEKIAELPESWIVAGIIGKDMAGNICGRLHDMRIPLHFSTSHKFPEPASCFDECCIIVNLKKGFRFIEEMPGFDLYGTLCVLQAKEMGGTAWMIDAFAEHYCMRSFSWFPDNAFGDCFKWLYKRFPNADRIDTTVLGVPYNKEKEA